MSGRNFNTASAMIATALALLPACSHETPDCEPYGVFEGRDKICLPKGKDGKLKIVKVRERVKDQMVEREGQLIRDLRLAIAANPLDGMTVNTASAKTLLDVLQLGIAALKQDRLNLQIQGGHASDLSLTREELSYLLKLSTALQRADLGISPPARELGQKEAMGITGAYEELRTILRSDELIALSLEENYLRADPPDEEALFAEFEGVRIAISKKLKPVRYLEVGDDLTRFVDLPESLMDRRFGDWVAVPVEVKLPKKSGEEKAPPNKKIASIVISKDKEGTQSLDIVPVEAQNLGFVDSARRTTLDDLGPEDFEVALTSYVLNRFEGTHYTFFNGDDTRGYTDDFHYFYLLGENVRDGLVCIESVEGCTGRGNRPAHELAGECETVLTIGPNNRTFISYRRGAKGDDLETYNSWEQMELEVTLRFEFVLPPVCEPGWNKRDYLGVDEKDLYLEKGRPIYRIP